MVPFPLPRPLIDQTLTAAFAEDLGDAGDLTTLATIPPELETTATLRARKPGRLAGLPVAMRAFGLIDDMLTLDPAKADGDALSPGDTILTISGSAAAILTAERIALNFLGRMSGIATATAGFVNAVAGTDVKIVCTRKTTPTLRAYEKHAVRCGGGHNHRFGLHDAVMIKDNHIAASGSITQALQNAKGYVGHTVKIEIEVDTLAQLEEVLAEGADIVLLDNMSTDQLREAVSMTDGRAVLEASGNVTRKTVRAIAETGIDVISSGWLTHSAPNLDLGLDIDLK